MRIIPAGVAVLLALVGVIQPVSAGSPGTAGALPSPSAGPVAQFHGATLARSAATGTLRFVGGSLAHPAATSAELGRPAGAAAAGAAFLSLYGTQFGIADPSRDVQLSRSESATGGRTVLRYQQLVDGVPVIAGEFVVQVSSSMDVVSVNGEATSGVPVSTRTAVAPAAARAHAIVSTAAAEKIDVARLSATSPALWIYDSRLLGTPGMPAVRPVWRVEVTGGPTDAIDELVLIDAQKGGVVLQFNQVERLAPTRVVCDQAGTT